VTVKSFCLLLALFIALSIPAQAQDLLRPDTTRPIGRLRLEPDPNAFHNSWGINLLVSTNGFGLGSFYRHEYSDDISGFLDFSISEAKDDDEKDYYDYYTGQRFTPGKVSRFLVLPLFVGVEKRLFADEIMDNFRPYVNIAGGPAMIFVFPYNEEYFNALGHGSPKYTFGGYIGLGAFFGSERSNLLGLNVRYYFIPYPGGLESITGLPAKKEFGGFFITLNFGSAW